MVEAAYKYDWDSVTEPATVVKPDPGTPTKKVTTTKPATPKMVYDVEKGCLVPFE